MKNLLYATGLYVVGIALSYAIGYPMMLIPLWSASMHSISNVGLDTLLSISAIMLVWGAILGFIPNKSIRIAALTFIALHLFPTIYKFHSDPRWTNNETLRFEGICIIALMAYAFVGLLMGILLQRFCRKKPKKIL